MAEELAREITRGGRRGAFRIESEHELCARFDLSRATIRIILADLEAQGLIYREHGRGTFAVPQDEISFQVKMSGKYWRRLDQVRGSLSRSEWIARQIRNAR